MTTADSSMIYYVHVLDMHTRPYPFMLAPAVTSIYI